MTLKGKHTLIVHWTTCLKFLIATFSTCPHYSITLMSLIEVKMTDTSTEMMQIKSLLTCAGSRKWTFFFCDRPQAWWDFEVWFCLLFIWPLPEIFGVSDKLTSLNSLIVLAYIWMCTCPIHYYFLAICKIWEMKKKWILLNAEPVNKHWFDVFNQTSRITKILIDSVRYCYKMIFIDMRDRDWGYSWKKYMDRGF